MIIYKITNNINNKVYIGQTTRDLKIRWYQHCYKTKAKNICNRIYNAIQKHGKENFEIKLTLAFGGRRRFDRIYNL